MVEFIIKYWLQALFGLLLTILTYLYRRISIKIKEQDSIKNGIQAILRDRIIQSYTHYLEEKYCPIFARDNVENMYQEYHNLGGNGVVTDLVHKLFYLPTEKPKDDESQIKENK